MQFFSWQQNQIKNSVQPYILHQYDTNKMNFYEAIYRSKMARGLTRPPQISASCKRTQNSLYLIISILLCVRQRLGQSQNEANCFIIQMFFNSYQDYYYKHYFTRGGSGGHLICLLTAYLVIALPFYFAFGGSNFWLDPQNQPMTTSYNYTGYYAVQVNFQNSSASSPFGTHEFSNIPGKGMTSPSSTSVSIQINDQLTSGTGTFTVAGYSGVEILSVNVIMYFQVYFAELDKSVLCGWMWNTAGNVISGAISTNLEYASSTSISKILSNSVVNLPPYYPNLVGGFIFSTLADELVTGSNVLHTRSQQQIVTDVDSALSSRSISLLYSKKRSVLVHYIPSLLQTLKFKYSRYLAFAIISYFVFSTLFKLYVKEGLIDCQSLTERVR